MDALAILYPEGWRWDKTALTYAVDPTLAAWLPYVDVALSQWSAVCGLEFSAARFEDADIQITTLTAVQAPPGAVAWSLIWTDDHSGAIDRGFVGLPASPGGDAAWVALHEIGHTLGLSHPHQETLGMSGDQSLTVMSYIASPDGALPDGPATLDVAAMQALYGPDRTVTAGGLVQGGTGYDILRGGEGSDTLLGGQGNDTLYGGPGADAIHGGQGGDTLFGGRGNDQLLANLGDDVLCGDAGNDTLHGGQGNDHLLGGDGNDWLSGDLGNDTLLGGGGADVFTLAAGSGYDRVLDFSAAEGDRIAIPSGASWSTVRTVHGGVVMVMDGAMLEIEHVLAISPEWITVA